MATPPVIKAVATSAANPATTPTPLSLPAYPAAVAVGDRLVVLVSMAVSGSTNSWGPAPTGWTKLAETTGAGTDIRTTALLSRVVASVTESPGTIAPQGFTGSYNATASMIVLGNAGSVTASSVATGTDNAALTVTAPSVTGVNDNELLLFMLAVGNISVPATPAGMTATASVIATTTDPQYAWSQTLGAVATGTRTTSWTGGTRAAAYNVLVNRANVAPDTATGLTPASGAIDRAITQRLAWIFSDPDPGDTQSKFDLRYRVVATVPWTTVTGTTTNSFYEAPPNTFAAGDYEWQVLPYDALGVPAGGAASPMWSASAFFTAANMPVGPTFVSPTSGATITASSVIVTFSYPSLQEWQWRVLADNAGAPADPAVPANVLNAGATVTDTTSRAFTVTGLANNVPVHPQVRAKTNGLYSGWVDIRYPVSFTPPATPTLGVTPNSLAGTISLAIANPVPGAGQPAVSSVDVAVRATTPGDPYRPVGVAVSIARNTGLSFTDRAPSSGITYEYQVTANGANGTSTPSVWTG